MPPDQRLSYLNSHPDDEVWAGGTLPLAIGDLFADRYRITGVLWREGFTVTYRAYDEHLSDDVALIMATRPAQESTDSYIAATFAGKARRARNPKRISTRGIAGRPNRHALVTDFPSGRRLSDLLNDHNGRLPWPLIMTIARSLTQVAVLADEAEETLLAYAPEHLWVDATGNIRLGGMEHAFGIAAVIGAWAGPAHASPEMDQLIADTGWDPWRHPKELLREASREFFPPGMPITPEHANWYGVGRVLLQLVIGPDSFRRRNPKPQPSQITAQNIECSGDLAEVISGLLREPRFERDAFITRIKALFPPDPPNSLRQTASASTATITDLTGRETEVLSRLVQGHTNREISGMLSISRHTVDRHVQNVYRKLGVRRRVDAVRLATSLGLFD